MSQENILGLLRVLIYVNDIYLTAPELTFNLFIDDTCIFYFYKGPEQMEVTLNNVIIKTNR